MDIERSDGGDGDGAVLYGASNDSLLSTASLSAAADLWTRKGFVWPSGTLRDASNSGFSKKEGWGYVWMQLDNRSNAIATDTMSVDLSMVGKLRVKSQEFWDGTYWKSGFWF